MISFFKKKKERDSISKRAITDMDFVVVDTELTGLNEFRDNIIAIGAIKMKGRTIRIGDVFYRTVSPSTKKIRKESIMIHEITPSELENCPEIKPILKEFIQFSKECMVVGHCINIDLAFLRKEIKSNLGVIFEPLSVDTLLIYKWLVKKGMLPGDFVNKNSLEDIAVSLDIEPKELHDALADAFITAQIFQKLLSYLWDLKMSTVGDLLQIGSTNERAYESAIKKEAYQF